MKKHININTFPSVQISTGDGKLPVEVSLIAQLSHGSGNGVYESVLRRQQNHPNFVDELDEPSAKLGGTDFAKGDMTSLYSFIVGAEGHPFHKHVGHRVFIAIAGSGGAQLRFSTASMTDIEADPQAFVNALHYINIPADGLFTVRFGGETWHQFVPLYDNLLHPTFVALSCHTNELGGLQSESLKQKVINNRADIPSLTETLPLTVEALLKSEAFKRHQISTTSLALDAPEGMLHRLMCTCVRGTSGLLHGAMARFRKPVGYISRTGQNHD